MALSLVHQPCILSLSIEHKRNATESVVALQIVPSKKEIRSLISQSNITPGVFLDCVYNLSGVNTSNP